MDLSLRDALGGGGHGVPAGAPAEALLKRDFVASLEKESYDDKVGENVSKSDYRPLLDGKDMKSGKSPGAFKPRREKEVMLVCNVVLTPEGTFCLSLSLSLSPGGGHRSSGSRTIREISF